MVDSSGLVYSMVNMIGAARPWPVLPHSSKYVLVTGASSGIGEAIALALDSLEFHVFAGVRREADAAALRSRASSRLKPLILDVTDSGMIHRAAEAIRIETGSAGLYGLVNNAGIVVAGPLQFLPVDRVRRQFEVNVLGQLGVTQAMLPLIRAGSGRIINMGSISGHLATPFLGPYAASKHALEALSESLRVELRPWNIPVCIVDPGNVATPIWEKSKSAAEATVSQAPPEQQVLQAELYGAALNALRAYVSRVRGMHVDHVVRAVNHALMSERPKARYFVKPSIRFSLVLNLLPATLRDRIIMKELGTG